MTAAAGDRPQSVDPGPVSNHAVLGPRHVALAMEDMLQARYLVDAASIDAEGLVSAMAYHGGNLIGPMPETTDWRHAPREHPRSKTSSSIGIARSLSTRSATACGSGVPTATSDLRWCTPGRR